MIKCNHCEQVKDPEQFNWKNKSKSIRQTYCRDCKKVHQKKYYNENKHKYIAQVYEARSARQKIIKAQIKEHLTKNPCIDCGNSDIRVLHFDHVRGTKISDISKMTHNGLNWDKIKEEIDKCEVRCANCHMIRTYPQRLN